MVKKLPQKLALLTTISLLLDKYDYHFSPGDIVAGTVFSIEPRGALIDIGAKTAAYSDSGNVD